jgi:nitrite reductase (NADH) small subunit
MTTVTPWVPVCTVEDIPMLGARRVERERGMSVALFRTAADRVHALLDRCPHKGGPLSQGIVAGEGVACPLHGWTIGLADGRARAPDEGCTPTFECRVEDGVVMLDGEQLASRALDLTAPVAGPCARRCAAEGLGPGAGPQVGPGGEPAVATAAAPVLKPVALQA